MLRKNNALSACAAALLASASALQPAAAQTGAYGAPRDLQPDQEFGDQYYAQDAYGEQGYEPNNLPYTAAPDGDIYDAAANENYERERAAQEWRAKYQTGYAPQANSGYGGQNYPGEYSQTGQDYYPPVAQGSYPPPDQRYYGRGNYYPEPDHYAYRRACQRQRANNQVGGLIFGAIAGGLFGNAVSHRRNRGGATAMGMVMGGALGAGIAGNMDCDDHYYYRRTYYDGFQRGYPNRTYRWHNPNSGHHGDFHVGDYYQGPGGQDCATYAQTIWVRGRPERASGYACRRGDGSWEIMS